MKEDRAGERERREDDDEDDVIIDDNAYMYNKTLQRLTDDRSGSDKKASF